VYIIGYREATIGYEVERSKKRRRKKILSSAYPGSGGAGSARGASGLARRSHRSGVRSRLGGLSKPSRLSRGHDIHHRYRWTWWTTVDRTSVLYTASLQTQTWEWTAAASQTKNSSKFNRL